MATSRMPSDGFRTEGLRQALPAHGRLAQGSSSAVLPTCSGGRKAFANKFQSGRASKGSQVIDLEERAGEASTAAASLAQSGAPALEASQTLSGVASAVATEASQPRFKMPLKTNSKRKSIDLADRDHRREREQIRRQKDSVKVKEQARQKKVAYKVKDQVRKANWRQQDLVKVNDQGRQKTVVCKVRKANWRQKDFSQSQRSSSDRNSRIQ